MRFIPLLLVPSLLLGACAPAAKPELHGYVEGEYVRVAAPFAGQLTLLAVQRGMPIKAGEALFALEQENEKAARLEAGEKLQSAASQLANLQKGKRPDEVASVAAQLAQARAAAHLSQVQLQRDEKLVSDHFISPDRLDQSRAARDRDQAHVVELAAQLRVTKQGARSDEIDAARAEMKAAQAAVAQAQWRLEQKSLRSPVTGLVDDTLYTTGEWVPAGMPVVSLLPPANIKIRFFIPEPQLAKFKIGQPLQIGCDACAKLNAHVSYVSSQAEYTPPVIYSNEARAKLVYMAEAQLAPEDAVKLHPGQPVDILVP
jgi:HlyD family secretion protein